MRTHTRGVSKYVDYTRDDYASKRRTLLRRNSLIIPFTALHIAHATSFPRFPRRGVTRRGRCETREATPLVWHAEIQPAEFAIVGDFSLRGQTQAFLEAIRARARARIFSLQCRGNPCRKCRSAECTHWGISRRLSSCRRNRLQRAFVMAKVILNRWILSIDIDVTK